MLMERWGSCVVKYRWMIVGIWVALAVIFGGLFAGQLSPLLTGGGWSVPDSSSYRAYEKMAEKFTSRSATSLTFVAKDHHHEVGSDRFKDHLRSIKELLLNEEAIESVYTWLDAPEELKAQFADERNHVTFGFVELNIDEGFAQKELPVIQERLSERADRLGMEVVILGAAAMWGEVNRISQEGLSNAHLYAIPLILIILFFVFRSIVSSFMPLLLAGFTIAVTFGVLYFVARQAELSIFILDASMMLGIGLGIDFALIFVSRFREELQKDAQHIVSAVLQTMRTAGHAIFYSSLTIMGAMSALLIVEIAAIRAMALGIIVTVFILLLLSMSFLPAVVAIMGSKINAWKIPSWGRKAHANRWYKMSHRVMKRPLLYIVIFTSVLGLLAWPAVQLQTSTPDVRMLPEESVVRRGVEMMQQAFGLGVSSPIQIVLEGDADEWMIQDNMQWLASFMERLEMMDGVDSVVSYVSYFPDMEPEMVQAVVTNLENKTDSALLTMLHRYISENYDTVIVEVISHQHASSEGMKDLVTSIREHIQMAQQDRPSLSMYVGGQTAEGIDTSDSLRSSLGFVTVFTLALIFIILLFTFKSILLPLKAIILNIISLGATYGILIIVFQWGLGSEWFGFGDYGYIQNFVPLLLLGLLFSLSTDYEVFLLMRVKEEYEEGKSNEESVALGLEKTAPMISGAALIMISVFASFAFAGILPMQQLGLGMAVAIALDATIVRLLLVPATMKLLGRWNWWFPFQKLDECPSDSTVNG